MYMLIFQASVALPPHTRLMVMGMSHAIRTNEQFLKIRGVLYKEGALTPQDLQWDPRGRN